MDKYTIQRDDELVRRVPTYLSDFIKDGKPTSAAFKTKPNEDGLSVHILKLTTIDKIILDKDQFVVAIFKASIPMDAGFVCEHDQKPDNYAHALIKGNTRRIARKLSRHCRVEKI